MKLAVVIDPIERLNPKKDSSIAMLAAAQKLGLKIFYMTQADMSVENGKAQAWLTQIEVNFDNTSWYSETKSALTLLSELDIILMRKDPPFDMNYIYSTYLLELSEKDGVLIVNKPQSLRDANEKYFTTMFPDCSPLTLISQDLKQLKQFWQTHQDVIYKPLDGMGGRDIYHVDKSGSNLNVILDQLTNMQTTPIMAQKYLPAIKTNGDRRILIVDDYIVPYALARIPQGDDERGNLAQGAIGKVLPVSQHEQNMLEKIIPTLQQKGLIFVGVDIIGDSITEINVTSPTCIVEIEQASNQKIAERLIEKLILMRQ